MHKKITLALGKKQRYYLLPHQERVCDYFSSVRSFQFCDHIATFVYCNKAMDSVFEDFTYNPKPKQDEKLETYARVIDMVVLFYNRKIKEYWVGSHLLFTFPIN